MSFRLFEELYQSVLKTCSRPFNLVKSSRRGMKNFILDIKKLAKSDIFTIFLDRVLIRVQDIMEGIQVAFAYVFGYSYVAELPKSLEFIQR